MELDHLMAAANNVTQHGSRNNYERMRARVST